MGFLGVNFWSRVFIGVMLEALGMFLGNCFDHPRHLNPEYAPPPPPPFPPGLRGTHVKEFEAKL